MSGEAMKIEDRVLDGRAVAAEIRADVAARVEKLVAAGGRKPGLGVLLVGDDPASKVYVGMKTRACEEAGMVGRSEFLPASASAAEIRAKVQQLNEDNEVDGFLVQLPLPDGIEEREILNLVDPAKDVDGFHTENVGRLWLDDPDGLAPATPSGVMEMLRRYDIPLSGSHAVVVGRSTIVGKPQAALLLRANCTVTVCHSRTKDLAAVCRQADVLIAAVGRPAMITPDHVREGAVVIDVGTNRVEDRAEVERLFPGDAKRLETLERRGGVLVGDVDYTAVRPKVRGITPVPGGVGPLTVAMLLSNALKASRRRQGL